MANRAVIERMLNRDFAAAYARGREELAKGPRAIAVKLGGGKIIVVLDSGVEIRFPPALAQGLRGARRADLADAVIEAKGLGIHWPKLDADLYVPALARGVLGTPQWMATIGRAGGRARSEAKAKAARANGAKGGRPRKSKARHAPGTSS